MPETPIPIERDDHILRARRTAATTRIALGLIGIALIAARPDLIGDPALATIGFAAILATSLVQLTARVSWIRVEESVAGIAALTIIGLGDQSVTVLSVIWLVAVATGVMARGGRVHWIGRSVVLTALALPIAIKGGVSADYAAFCVAVIGLQLTSGRLTRELNRLLRQARLEAENAETLLLAGDIAERVTSKLAANPETVRPARPAAPSPLTAVEEENARQALAKLVRGEGLAIAMQPIVEIADGSMHAYEALARFRRRRSDHSPLHWFRLADELGERAGLERACLRAALKLFEQRPPETRVSINLSAPTLLDPETYAMLDAFGCKREGELEGLIVEITEETLVENDSKFVEAIDSLRRRGAGLAVDDIGAGYSGLRQITAVVPDYMKLDRSLISGIDHDDDRAALVRALAGYARQVGGLLVAEGIEHRAELERLRELGVPLAQGFYLAEPGKPWPELSEAAALTLSPGSAPEPRPRSNSLEARLQTAL